MTKHQNYEYNLGKTQLSTEKCRTVVGYFDLIELFITFNIWHSLTLQLYIGSKVIMLVKFIYDSYFVVSDQISITFQFTICSTKQIPMLWKLTLLDSNGYWAVQWSNTANKQDSEVWQTRCCEFAAHQRHLFSRRRDDVSQRNKLWNFLKV